MSAFARTDQNSTGLRRLTARTPSGTYVSHDNDLAVFHITPRRNPTSRLVSVRGKVGKAGPSLVRVPARAAGETSVYRQARNGVKRPSQPPMPSSASARSTDWQDYDHNAGAGHNMGINISNFRARGLSKSDLLVVPVSKAQALGPRSGVRLPVAKGEAPWARAQEQEWRDTTSGKLRGSTSGTTPYAGPRAASRAPRLGAVPARTVLPATTPGRLSRLAMKLKR